MKLFRCKVCGQVVKKLKDTGMPLVCCGEEMEEVSVNTNEEGLKEKHIPVYEINNNRLVVKVGEKLHPMSEDHYIEWISVSTNKGFHTQMFKPGQNPIAVFRLCKGEMPVSIYAYCNIHSLWKKNCCNNIGYCL